MATPTSVMRVTFNVACQCVCMFGFFCLLGDFDGGPVHRAIAPTWKATRMTWPISIAGEGGAHAKREKANCLGAPVWVSVASRARSSTSSTRHGVRVAAHPGPTQHTQRTAQQRPVVVVAVSRGALELRGGRRIGASIWSQPDLHFRILDATTWEPSGTLERLAQSRTTRRKGPLPRTCVLAHTCGYCVGRVCVGRRARESKAK